MVAKIVDYTIEPVAVVRDEWGNFYHPVLEKVFGDAEEIPMDFFRDQGLEIHCTMMEDELNEGALDAWIDLSSPDISHWTPKQPDGEGWFIVSLGDTEDGPVCYWARKKSIEVSIVNVTRCPDV